MIYGNIIKGFKTEEGKSEIILEESEKSWKGFEEDWGGLGRDVGGCQIFLRRILGREEITWTTGVFHLISSLSSPSF